MKSDDYVKYLTEQFVHYMNQPRDFRKQMKAERKLAKSSIKEELFGLVPFACSQFFGTVKKQIKSRR
ncbi:YqzE family protein [Pullulanibacillus sp. KACC 23026]|uniref:YqzE family protein n=1 Tax=Pullulanibacillus sp. KACC 23026 TaxID=3028315 RepID=UPI0023B0022D|nr:YqzE family protein [Pullulanibacillus sp. KACC 23026]WEG14283.1 YqzE family protein [Pullulanibacillus sp. KACC 23026]